MVEKSDRAGEIYRDEIRLSNELRGRPEKVRDAARAGLRSCTKVVLHLSLIPSKVVFGIGQRMLRISNPTFVFIFLASEFRYFDRTFRAPLKEFKVGTP